MSTGACDLCVVDNRDVDTLQSLFNEDLSLVLKHIRESLCLFNVMNVTGFGGFFFI